MDEFSDVSLCGSLLVKGHWEDKSNIPWKGMCAEKNLNWKQRNNGSCYWKKSITEKQNPFKDPDFLWLYGLCANKKKTENKM